MSSTSFLLSKFLWFVFRPDNLIVLGFVVAVFLLRTRFHKLGRRLLLAVTAVLVSLSFLPIGEISVGILEDRFQVPGVIPENTQGIIVLGGAIEPDVSADRNVVALNSAAERMTEVLPLLKHHPGLRVVFATGSGLVLDQVHREADFARRWFADQGADFSRMLFERNSRTTYENAIEVAKLVSPLPRGPWLLVTSAFHMPRAVGTFRKAGFDVIPYPVDYRTLRSHSLHFSPGLFDSAEYLRLGIKEWGGLVIYYLMGRTSALLP